MVAYQCSQLHTAWVISRWRSVKGQVLQGPRTDGRRGSRLGPHRLALQVSRERLLRDPDDATPASDADVAQQVSGEESVDQAGFDAQLISGLLDGEVPHDGPPGSRSRGLSPSGTPAPSVSPWNSSPRR